MDMDFEEMQSDLKKLETMKAEYQSLTRGRGGSVGTSRSGGLEKRDRTDLMRKRDAIESFEQQLRTKVACYKGAVKVGDTDQACITRKLKENYGFEGSILIGKYVSLRDREEIKLEAHTPGRNKPPIEWFEESDRPTPFEDHWIVHK